MRAHVKRFDLSVVSLNRCLGLKPLVALDYKQMEYALRFRCNEAKIRHFRFATSNHLSSLRIPWKKKCGAFTAGYFDYIILQPRSILIHGLAPHQIIPLDNEHLNDPQSSWKIHTEMQLTTPRQRALNWIELNWISMKHCHTARRLFNSFICNFEIENHSNNDENEQSVNVWKKNKTKTRRIKSVRGGDEHICHGAKVATIFGLL